MLTTYELQERLQPVMGRLDYDSWVELVAFFDGSPWDVSAATAMAVALLLSLPVDEVRFALSQEGAAESARRFYEERQ